jgi:hypothetical protein
MDDPQFVAVDGAKGNFAPDWPDIKWEMVIKPADIPGTAGLLKQLTMTLTWNEERRKISFVKYLPQSH